MNKTGILISGVIGLVAVGAVAATTLSLGSAVGAEAAGMRTDPPPSVPIPTGPIPEDTAADAPPLLPPGVRSVFHGFRVVPNTRLSVAPFQPNSGLLVRPISTAPACLSRATSGVSSRVTLCSNHFEPNVVRSPSM